MGSGLLHPKSERYQWQTVTIQRLCFCAGAASKEMKSVQENVHLLYSYCVWVLAITASPLHDHPLSRWNVRVPYTPNAL